MEFVYQGTYQNLDHFVNQTDRPMLVFNIFVFNNLQGGSMPAIYDQYGNMIGWVSTYEQSAGLTSFAVGVTFRPFVLLPGWMVKLSGVPLGIQALVLDGFEDLRGIL